MIKTLQGDSRSLLKTLRDNTIHCVVTSPPYWGLRDYGVPDQIGLEPDFNTYIATITDIFREVRRVLRPDGTCWINLGDSYVGSGKGGNPEHAPHIKQKTNKGSLSVRDLRSDLGGLKPKDLCGIPWRVALALQADGWYLRQDIIWHKPNPMPESVADRCTKSHEYLFLLSKSERYYFDNEAIKTPTTAKTLTVNTTPRKGTGVESTGEKLNKWMEEQGGRYHPAMSNKRSVWTITTRPYKDAHFATFPPKLVEPCILAGTSEKGCCAKCGAPWARVTKLSDRYAAFLGKGYTDHEADDVAGRMQNRGRNRQNAMRDQGGITTKETETLGWSPACSCNAAVVPCIVLDPFAGSGTVGEVCNTYNRHAILFELNPDYVKLIEKRTTPPMQQAAE